MSAGTAVTIARSAPSASCPRARASRRVCCATNEGQGLLEPERSTNDYRAYGPDAVERVERLRGLIQSGLPTRLIRILLDMEHTLPQHSGG